MGGCLLWVCTIPPADVRGSNFFASGNTWGQVNLFPFQPGQLAQSIHKSVCCMVGHYSLTWSFSLIFWECITRSAKFRPFFWLVCLYHYFLFSYLRSPLFHIEKSKTGKSKGTTTQKFRSLLLFIFWCSRGTCIGCRHPMCSSFLLTIQPIPKNRL